MMKNPILFFGAMALAAVHEECGSSMTRTNVACALAKAKWPANFRVHVGLVGDGGEAGRVTAQEAYVSALVQSQIVVTCNPDGWEGDQRLSEALASGALVLCDRMLDPPPYAHGRHLLYYSSVSHLFELLAWVRGHPDEADAIAAAGRDAARTFDDLAREIVGRVGGPLRVFVEGTRALEGADAETVAGLRHVATVVDDRRNATVLYLPLWRLFTSCSRRAVCFESKIHTVLDAALPHQRVVAVDWHDHADLLPAPVLADESRIHFLFKRSRVVKRRTASPRWYDNYNRTVYPLYYAVNANKRDAIDRLVDDARRLRPTNLSCFLRLPGWWPAPPPHDSHSL